MKITILDHSTQKSLTFDAKEFNNPSSTEVKFDFENSKKFDYRDIKTFEDACKKLGINVINFNNEHSNYKKHVLAFEKLTIIFEAINDGWKADFSNPNEAKYNPWFQWDESSGFSFRNSFFIQSISDVSSLLSTNTREKSDYIGKQFIDIYDDFLNN